MVYDECLFYEPGDFLKTNNINTTYYNTNITLLPTRRPPYLAI